MIIEIADIGSKSVGVYLLVSLFKGSKVNVIIDMEVFYPLTPKKSRKAIELYKSAIATMDTFLQLRKTVQA